MAHEQGFMRGLHGALRRLAALDASEDSKVAEAERQAINAPVQRLGSDLGVGALGRLAAQLIAAGIDWMVPIAFVHDALYFYVREGHELEGVEAIVYAMQTVPLEDWFGLKMPVPIVAEPDIGVSFSDKIELGDWHGKSVQALRDSFEKDDKNPRPMPEWLDELTARQDILNYRKEPTKPAWWNDLLDTMGPERFYPEVVAA